ncbi:MAG: DUF3592 domain-containing protein [Clostridiaceae bacterium]|nr:DUF3592 domain-containing protein [Clostridiaceae bacterium]
MYEKTVTYFDPVGGVGFLLFGFHELSNGLELTRNGLRTEGTVINLENNGSGKKLTYMPKIEFITDTGQKVMYVYRSGSNPPAYSIGQRVNQENFIIGSNSSFVFPIVLILAGAALILCVIAVFAKRLIALFHFL